MVALHWRGVLAVACLRSMALAGDGGGAVVAMDGSQIVCSFDYRPGTCCDGAVDDTRLLQQALTECTVEGVAVVLRAGSNCTVHPLILPSHVSLRLEEGSQLQAALRADWPLMREDGTPSLLYARAAHNLSISGLGTIDGRGQAWWLHSQLPRPHALVLDNCSDVELSSFTLRDPAQYAIEITGGSDGSRPGFNYEIHRVKVVAPDFQTAPNTDGRQIVCS